MKKELSLLKPTVEHKFLENEVAERVEYIDVPGDIGLVELRDDIENGAVHMKGLEYLLTKENEPKYIIVDAVNEEQAYMAVSYLASCFAKKHKRWPKEVEINGEWDGYEYELQEGETLEFRDYIEGEDDGDGAKWTETAYHIPVLNTADLISVFRQASPDSFSIATDNYMAGAKGIPFMHRPYWLDCRREAVCIILKNGPAFGFFEDTPDALQEALEYFEYNDKVYLINVKQKEYTPINFLGDFDNGFGDDFNTGHNEEEQFVEDNPLKNQILLSFAADEVMVRFEKEAEEKNYYQKVFHSWLEYHAIGLNKGFRYDSILDIIKCISRGKMCYTIDKVLLYAIKDKKVTEGLTLKNSDFAFVNHFVKSCAVEKKDKSLKTAWDQLEQKLVGMKAVKQQIKDTVYTMKLIRYRKAKGLGEAHYHNTHLLLGAPGTAKTTVAKLMGDIMVAEKLLPGNRFICVNGAELKGKYVGHSAPKVKSYFAQYDIIVIDEAYSLVDMKGETDSFSSEVIAQIVSELEEHATDKLVIFAGYGGKDVSERNNLMKVFLDSNPGIKSRITSTIYFESYQADEMVEIFKRIAANEDYLIEEGAEAALRRYFESRRNDSNFGNGREARSLLEASSLEMSKRLFERKGNAKFTKKDVQLIHAEDILKAIDRTRAANQAQEGRKGKGIGFQHVS